MKVSVTFHELDQQELQLLMAALTTQGGQHAQVVGIDTAKRDKPLADAPGDDSTPVKNPESEPADAGAGAGVGDSRSPGRRRNRTNDQVAVGGGGAPRRRRGTAASPPADAKPDDKPASDSVSGRRRKRESASAGTADPKGETSTPAGKASAAGKPQLSDADLLKAASEAAEVIAPAGVMDVLADFTDAGNINSISSERRQEFVDALQAKMKLQAGREA